MESIYERKITLQEELRMKYQAVKKLDDLGYTSMKKGKDILISFGKDNIGKLTYDKVENIPIAIVEKRKFISHDLLVTRLVMRRNREIFKETLLDVGWAVSNPN